MRTQTVAGTSAIKIPPARLHQASRADRRSSPAPNFNNYNSIQTMMILAPGMLSNK
ncbi:MAG: hypothetical protein O8C61_07170 [Candidatus Methanoperedens sp.]|nr:hypothetical protein [Candidatus Methanoperedens sp.]